MNNRSKKMLLIIGAGLMLFVINFVIVIRVKAPGKPVTPAKREEPQKETKRVIPPAKALFVPYTVQAPFGKWGVHEESCEEAAVLMYHYFLTGGLDENLEPGKTDQELVSLKDWQVKNWGREPDLSLKQLGDLAKEYWGYEYKIVSQINEATIKEQITAGNPVMVPVMTHSLKNPHYNVNDSYHILLIKGYDEKGVITNDAGIKEGKSWHYSWEVLWSAISAQKVSPNRELLILSK